MAVRKAIILELNHLSMEKQQPRKPGPSNLRRWKETAKETLDDPRVQTFLRKMFTEQPQLPTDEMLETLDESMRDYAASWANATEMHLKEGTYDRMIEFFKPGKGLVLDVGCGAGGLVSRLRRNSVLGVDINNYSLAHAAANLAAAGMEPNVFAGSHISFDPEKGFILKPDPIMQQLDLGRANLVCDDIRTLSNTIRVLYNQGVRADMVVMTLFGGTSSYKKIEFFDILRAMQKGERIDQPFIYADVIDSIAKICHRGGRVLLGVRGSEMLEENKDGKEESLLPDMEKKLDIVRDTCIELPNERMFVDLTPVVKRDGEYKTVDLKEIAGSKMKLHLLDTIVK